MDEEKKFDELLEQKPKKQYNYKTIQAVVTPEEKQQFFDKCKQKKLSASEFLAQLIREWLNKNE